MARTEDKSRHPKIVLLVEDDMGLTMLMTDLVREMGYKVVHTSDGKSAFAWLENHRPFLILLDYSLPDMTCLDLIEWVERTTQREMPPFIVITGAGDERISVDVMKRGALDYLIKDPMLFANLPRTLSNVRQRIETQQRLADAEAALHERERQYRELIESQGEGIGIVDLNEVFTFANPAAEEIFGVSKGQLEGRNLYEFVDKETADLVAAETVKRAEGGKSTYEIRITREDGEYRDLLVTATPKLDETRTITGTFGIFRDITEQKRAEEALRERDIRLEKLSSQIPGMLYQFMLKPDGTFCVPYSNKGIQQIFGCSPQDVVDDFEPIANAIYPEDYERVVSTILESARDLSNFHCEFRVHIPGRDIQWIWSNSVPEKLADGSIVWHGYNADVTERILAEEELHLSNERFELASQASGVGVWDWNIIIGKLQWTDKLYEVFGLDPQTAEASFATWKSVLHPEDRQQASDKITKALEEHAVLEQEYRVIYPDGSVHWINALGKGEYDDQGKPFRMTGVCLDITDRKRTERKLKKTLEQENILLELHAESNSRSDRELFQIALEKAIQLTDSTIGFFHLVSSDQKDIILTTWGDETLKSCTASYDTHYPIEQAGNWVDCVRLKHPVIYNDFPNSPNQKGLPEGHSSITRFMSIPVVENDKVEIIFGVGNKEEDYDDHDMTQLQLVANELHKIIRQRRADEALKESEAHFRSIFETIPDPVSISRLRDGTFVDVNDPLCHYSGFTREELLGGNALTMNVWRSEDERNKFIAVLLQYNFVQNFEVNFRLKDGRICPCLLSAQIMNLRGEPHILTMVRDITQIRQAEEAVRESENRYRTVADNTYDWEFWLGPSGNFVYISPSVHRITGYTVDELMADPDLYLRMIYPDDLEDHKKHRLLALQAMCPKDQNHEFRIRRKDGEIRWIGHKCDAVFDNDGNYIGVRGSNRDITTRKRIEQELEFQHKLMSAIIASSQQPIFAVDKNYCYTAFNSSHAQVMKALFNKDIAIGTNILDCHTVPEERELAKRNLDRTLSGETVIVEHLAGDEKFAKIYFYIVHNPVRDTEGLVIGAAVYAQDLSERMRVELELRESEQTLRAFLNAIPEPATLFDTNRNILATNSAMAVRAGLNIYEIVGHNALVHFPEHLNSSRNEEFEKALTTGKTVQFEDSRDGRDWVHYFNPILDSEGSVSRVATISFDITERKKVEEVLQVNKTHLLNAMRIGKLGHWQYDFVNDLFTFNDEFYTLFRTTAEQVGGYTMSAARYAELFVHPDDISLVAKVIQQSIETTDPNYDCLVDHRIIYADGEIGYISVRFQIQKDSHGRTVRSFGMNQDITERKQAEIALSESEQRFHDLFERAPLGYQSLDEDGHFIEINQAWLDTLGYTREEVVGKWFGDFLMPEYTEAFRKRFPLFKAAGQIHSEFEMCHKNGDRRYIAFEGRIGHTPTGEFLQTHCILQDITERKQAERELEHLNVILRAVYENTDTLIYTKNLDSRIMVASPTLARALGKQQSEIVGHIDAEFHAPEVAAMTMANDRAVMQSRKAQTFEETINAPDGPRTFLSTKSPWYNKQQEVIGVIGVSLDITDSKRVEEALRDSEEKYRSLFESMLEGCAYCEIIFDDEGKAVDWVYLDVNSSFNHLTGFTDVIGKRATDVLTGLRQRLEKLLDIYGRVAATGVPETFELEAIPNTAWWNASVVSPFRGRVIAIYDDITERKHYEIELQRWAYIFEHAEWGIGIGSAGGEWLDSVNPAFAKMHGREAKDMIGYPILDLFPPEVHQDVQNQIRIAVETGHHTFESKHVRADGTVFPILIDLTSVKDDTGKLLYRVASVYDMTELRSTQEALKTSEEQLRFALEGTNDGIWDVQMATGAVYMSQRGCEILGYSFEELPHIVQTWNQLVHPDDLLQTNGRLQAHFDGREPVFQVEQRLRTKSGDWKWVLTRGKVVEWDSHRTPLRVTGTHTDIDDRKKMETVQRVLYQILEVSSQTEKLEDFLSAFHTYLNELVEATNFYVALFHQDTATYSFPYFVDEIDLMPTGSKTIPNTLTDYVRRTGKPLLVDQTEIQRLITDEKLEIGGTLPQSWLGVPLKSDRGTIGVMTVQSYTSNKQFSQDHVTLMTMVSGQVAMAIERKLNQDALKASEDRLRMAQRMEAIGRLAGGVSHDFNNLLTAITGHSEIVLRQLNTNDPLRPDIEEISKTAQRAGNLTRQLLTFSRKQVVSPVVFNMDESVANMLRMLKRIIGENILLETSYQSSPWNVKADPGQIEQVIVNLAVNARDAMPRGGHLTIETLKVTVDQEFVSMHPEMEAGNYVMLAVSDTGIGMSADTQSRIFEPFFTTKAVGEGTGLGLATVYGIVKQSRGHILVQSVEGSGTTFCVYFPAVMESVPDKDYSSIKDTKLHGSEVIVLVEDNDSVRSMFSRVFRDYGYRIYDASSAEEALEITKGMPRPADMLVSDVILPDMNGRELAAAVRNLWPTVKVLLMSGYTADVIPEAEMETGLKLLQKPFGPVYLISKVREDLDEQMKGKFEI